MNDRQRFAEWLAAFRFKQAEWRAEKAVEFPDDHRNDRASKALRRLARYVAQHPGKPALLALDAMHRGRGLTEEGRQYISRFGFDSTRCYPPVALEELMFIEARALGRQQAIEALVGGES